MQPYDRGARFGFQSMRNPTGKFGSKSQAGGSQATEFQEASARNTVPTHDVVKGFASGHDNTLLG